MTIGRREFLKIMGGAAAGLALSQVPFTKLLAEQTAEKGNREVTPEVWAPSICTQCPAGCGILVRVVEGKAVKIEGNPLHPVNRGTLCPKGQAGVQLLYDPDRIQGPLKRSGERGSGQWQMITWEDAIREVADYLTKLRDTGEPHSFVLLSGQLNGLMITLLDRFCQSFGSPNHIRSNCYDGTKSVGYLTQGINKPFGYDLEKANYIISFGANMLESWWAPTTTQRIYGYLRQERAGKKAKFIQVDTRFSITASKADEWVPINPGTDGALALGMAYVIIREGLYNKEFVEKHTFGFEDWTDANGKGHLGFKNLVLIEYRPEEVSKITGISIDTIIRLAKDFASHTPSIALGERGSTMYSNGIHNRMAIHALNALVGSIEVPGGVVVPRVVPFQEWKQPVIDKIAERGLQRPGIDESRISKFPLANHSLPNLTENIINGRPYRANALFLYYTNPLFSTSKSLKFAQALEKTPLVVSFSPFMDESSSYADYILPDHTYLERWQEHSVSSVSGLPILGLGKPAVAPFHNTRDTGEVIMQLAQTIGGSVKESFPWKNYHEVLKESCEGVFKARRGTIFTEAAEEEQVKIFQERGWWVSDITTYEEFWAELNKKGGWWDPTYSFGEWGRIFKTPSQKYEFYSTLLFQKLQAGSQQGEGVKVEEREQELLLKELKIEARGDRIFLPHHEPVRFLGKETEFPFYLNNYRTVAQMLGRNANEPWLQEIAGLQVNAKWDSWVEINPKTAKALSIKSGDWVWIESAVGRAKTRARIFSGAMPNVINLPYGMGHRTYGRWAKNRGVNSNLLVGPDYNLAGLPSVFSTRVKIYKA
ncbi:MAG: molybdopterin-dependent oxidoreductase [Candidatus Tectomicrobia bacterium]|uniref:Molybdopterin-dependent oxidoreductase n=1 Tax=Tectimicrobiota bacterium TaxID=2528274 RepID=A0A933LQD1_UNCTE|nr:molybdopterin-dependent oxidoreductase [Candidatus Tectomicrobia bacterium]